MPQTPWLSPRNARELAYQVLEEHRETGEFAADLLAPAAAEAGVSGPDRRLAYELIGGTIRRQLTLDTLLGKCLKRHIETLEPQLVTVLRLGVYQLVFCSSIPVHAAVHETVGLAKRVTLRWGGFANGVLRSCERLLTTDTVSEPSANAVPISTGTYRLLRETVFPNPETSLAKYAATAFSLPEWLIKRWLGWLTPADILASGFWFNTVPNASLRVNRLKGSRDEYLTRLQEAGVDAIAGELPEQIVLQTSQRIDHLPGFDEGWFIAQDGTQMQVGYTIDPKPGEIILDACSAPGTKTTHLAELMGDTGEIWATDVSIARLAYVDQNAVRLGIRSIRSIPVRDDLADLPPGPFDAILLDVPCSNTGVLGKRPEARWRISPLGLTELVHIQRKLLTEAANRTTTSGRIVYSTCSIEPEENQQQIDWFLQENKDFRLVKHVSRRPGQPADGGYLALLTRQPADSAGATNETATRIGTSD